MKKRKGKEKFNFDYEGYNYLNDNLRLIDWIWEFIRRNETYIAKFNLFIDDIEEVINNILKGLPLGIEIKIPLANETVNKDLRFVINNIIKQKEIKNDDYKKKLYSLLAFIKRKLLTPKAEYEIIERELYGKYGRDFFKEFGIELPPPTTLPGIPDLTYFENREEKILFYIKDVSPVTITAPLMHDYHPSNLDSAESLFLRLNLNAPKIDVREEMKKLINYYYKKKTSKRKRKEKWKYYLIVYDLKKQYNLSNEIIADLLASAFPEEKNMFDAQNIDNYYNTALNLINGKYKEYVYS